MIEIKSKLRKIYGFVLAGLGFLLSPLSWWNDIIINIPLAYLMATTFSIVLPGHFPVFMILGYWFTNVLGLVLLHRGGQQIIGTEESTIYSTKLIIKDLTISLIYSLIIGVLAITNVLKLPTEYFK